MRLIVPILALAVTACAGATIEQPPSPYNSGPVPAHLVLEFPYYQVNSACRNHVAAYRAEACVMPSFIGRPIVILPTVGVDGVTQELQAALRSHEEGHLRGWKHK